MSAALRLAPAALAALLLTGCASIMKQEKEQDIAERNWDKHRAAIESIKRFNLHARVSSGGVFGIKGDLRWTQNADGSFEMRVSGPFGLGAVSIAGTEQQVEVKTKKGTYQSTDPEGWIKEKMGWTFPMLGLRRWVLGVPSPRSEAHLELDVDGLASVLEQDGWHLDYAEYEEHDEVMLPRKFEVANSEVKIKVVVDRWENVE